MIIEFDCHWWLIIDFDYDGLSMIDCIAEYSILLMFDRL